MNSDDFWSIEVGVPTRPLVNGTEYEPVLAA